MEPMIVNCERLYPLVKQYYAVDESRRDRILLTAQITHDIQQLVEFKNNSRANGEKKKIN